MNFFIRLALGSEVKKKKKALSFAKKLKIVDIIMNEVQCTDVVEEGTLKVNDPRYT